MGSKTSNAPAPDPRLVDAQIRSMGIQDEMIRRITENSDAMLPLQREQMQFGLDASRQAYNDSRDDRTWMLSRRGQLSGMQDRLARDADEFNTEDRRAQMRGEAMADVNQGFSMARDQGLRTMGRMGVNPNSGRAMAFNNEASLAQAAALSNASQKVNQAARAEGFALTDRAVNALAGYPAMSMQATGAGAGYGASGLGMVNQGLAGMNSGYGAAGSLAGQMGSNAAGMYGAMGSYKNGQDQIAAQNNPLGMVLGTATGAATRFGLGKLFGP